MGADWLMVSEVAQGVGRDASVVSKHLRVLREAGLVETGRGRLYRIPPQFVRDRAAGEVDFGFFLLRLQRDGGD